MIAHPVRYQILAATLTEAQRRLLRSLPLDIFNVSAGDDAPATMAALRREGLIERIPHDPVYSQIARHQLTTRGRKVQQAAEGMA